MKRFLALLLALASLLALCACGDSTPAAVKQVEEQIDALGEISLDSKDAIEAAEAAYAALSAEEKAQVRNVAVLQAARLVYDDQAEAQAAADAEAARLAAVQPFVGTWVVECPVYDPNPFELREDGSYTVNNYTAAWSYDPETDTLDLDGSRWIVFQEDGFTKLRQDLPNNSYAYVLEQDLEAARAKKYVAVELTSENVHDYIGDPIPFGRNVDAWGNPNSELLYFYPSPAAAQGLIWVGERDAAIEYATGYGWTSSFPWPGALEFGAYPLTGNAKGTLWYVRESYVAENTLKDLYDDGGYYRVLTFTGGEVFYLSPYVYSSNMIMEGDYADLVEFYNDHKY